MDALPPALVGIGSRRKLPASTAKKTPVDFVHTSYVYHKINLRYLSVFGNADNRFVLE